MQTPILPAGLKPWTPASQVQAMNDYLLTGSFDRLDFWVSFVDTFWAPLPPNGILLNFESPNKPNISGELGEGHQLPHTMLPHFFHTWATNCNLTRMTFSVPQAGEGVLKNGYAVLASATATVETLMLGGSLMVRQHTRMRFVFEQAGRLVQIEWTVMAHDEYFITMRAGLMMAKNFPMGMPERSPFICRWGFPMAVHRMLDIHSVLGEIIDERPLDVVPSLGLGSGGYFDLLGKDTAQSSSSFVNIMPQMAIPSGKQVKINMKRSTSLTPNVFENMLM